VRIPLQLTEHSLTRTPTEQPFDTPPFTPPSARELEALDHALRFRQAIRDGPFYAFLETDARAPKPGELSGSGALAAASAARDAAAAAAASPFERMRTYSQKFVKARRTMPRIAQQRYGACFFHPSL
jgi:DNA-directed RNA polymerase III subunit RPC7